jgi:alpha,alpha-trehalase
MWFRAAGSERSIIGILTFTMLGLEESGRSDLVRGMVENFAYLIDTFGHIPNGTRTYYLSRSQPPFFFAMVALLSRDDPAGAFAHYLPELKREYAFWMVGRAGMRPGAAYRRVVSMADGAILNRYWDDRAEPRDESFYDDRALAQETGREPTLLYRDIRAAAESGWDFSSRWFMDGRTRATINTTQIVPIDLNSLLYGLENAIRVGCQRQGDTACVKAFAARASARRAAIDRYLWDESQGAYVDYWWTHGARRSQLTAATLYPLFVRLAGQHQAMQVAAALMRNLLKPGGVVTTLLDTQEQWDAPNGWAPIQWIAVDGLRHYGSDSIAEAVACRWMVSVNRVYRQSGKLVEKYDVMTPGRVGGGGEYPTQDGFGWTNGVTRRFMALYPADAAFTSPGQCPTPQSSTIKARARAN